MKNKKKPQSEQTLDSNKKPFWKNLLINLLLVFFMFNFLMLCFEGILRIGLLDNIAVWTAPKYLLEDELTDARNYIFQARHGMLKFNDRFRSPQKPAHIKYRIAILGDSFLQGTSIDYDTVWSHQLENKLKAEFPEVEVLTFGRSGWPTVTEFAYLKQEGIKYNPDLAIFGFVTNDLQLKWGDPTPETPKRRRIPIMEKMLNGTLDFVFVLFSYTENIFPYSYLFLSSAINNTKANISGLYNEDGDRGGDGVYFYTEQYLNHYDRLLQEIKQFGDNAQIKVMFALTPNNHHEAFRKKYDIIIPFFKKNNLEYVDLYPAVKEKLGKFSYRELNANPTDGHPGGMVNTVYADEVYQWLKPQLVSMGFGKK